MEKRYKALYGLRGSSSTLDFDFVSTAENAQIVAVAIGKGQHAAWRVYVDSETGKSVTLWDCM